ncbi:hypothetical protein FOA52_008503 [Chlamydomonas sp. UWO 241]|nr:hypothetical protein FOA52_008503 [Chlamydomonas sp. UWO 241]
MAVAVSAAAGGTGHLAVQLALLSGARLVVALCGSTAKAAALRALAPPLPQPPTADQQPPTGADVQAAAQPTTAQQPPAGSTTEQQTPTGSDAEAPAPPRTDAASGTGSQGGGDGGAGATAATAAAAAAAGGAAAPRLVVIDASSLPGGPSEGLPLALAATCPGGFDVVYEGVGGAVGQALLAALSPTGRLLQVGYISEYPHARGYDNAAPLSPGAVAPAPSASNLASGPPSASLPGTTVAAAAASAAVEFGSPSASAGAQGAGSSGGGSRGGGGEGELPSCADLMWRGLTVARGRQVITGAVWPRDPRAVARARRKVFKAAAEGRLQVWIDDSHGLKGLASIPDAVDHMLRGQHIGKVVLEL